MIGACSHASPGSHEVSRTGLPRLDRVAPRRPRPRRSGQGHQAAESLCAPPPTWPPVPPTSRLETFSDAGARTEQYPLRTSARPRLAVKVERKPGAWSFFRVTSFFLIHLEKRDPFGPVRNFSESNNTQWPHAVHSALTAAVMSSNCSRARARAAAPGTGPSSVSSTGKGLTRSESARPHTGQARRPSCCSRRPTAARKLRCHRIPRHTSMSAGRRRHRLGSQPAAWAAEQGQVRRGYVSSVPGWDSACWPNAALPALNV